MEFKDKVILVRARLNLSQEKLGEMLHVSIATICRWENGKFAPSKKDLVAFEELCRENKIFFEKETF
jgi:DNA-binding XRE family transcriptional regulator